ncbi:MAG TPA: polyphosphate kinase 1 [Longimicrobiales bacterium]|nr:polyphosphate kinase 1 [Longimicrobiales bacterium]
MQPHRMVRFDVPDRETLERLAAGPLPGGLREHASELDFFRDVYFDTPSSDLKEKGAATHLRLHRDGRAELLLDVLDRRPENGPPRRRSAHALVTDVEPETLFRGESEPARMLRALIDPDRLEKVLEVETLRRVRRSGGRADREITFCYDLITVRRDDLATELFELEVSLPDEAGERLAAIIQELQHEHGLRPALAETQGRAREVLEDLDIQALEREIRAAREVAVVAYQRGAIGLLQQAGELVVPHAPGAGGQACRQALRDAFGQSRARIRLLGTSAGLPGRPSLQVWLAEDLGDANGGPIAWVGLHQLLDRAGGPGLRDPRTLAALHVVARSGFGSWAFAASRLADSETDAQPAASLEFVLQRLEAADGTQEGSAKEVPSELLLNMDLSRLAFDERILAFAEDPRTPLLERVRFLGMFGERRDDFFMTRVARFKLLAGIGSEKRSMDGMTPGEQLDAIGIRARQIMRRSYALLAALVPELERHGIVVERWPELSHEDREYLRETYGARLAALVTPLAADPTHPFPHIRNLRPALAATVRLRETGQEQFIAVELPGDLPRFVPLPGGHRFVTLEDVVEATLPELYRGLQVLRANMFRITRSANIDIDADPLDMLQAIEEKVTQRPFQEIVRLEVEKSMPPDMRHRLLRELQFDSEDTPTTLSEQDVYTVERFVDLAALEEIAALDLPELKFPPRDPHVPLEADRSVFDQVRERERFVHFPFDSFEESVERLLREAADDPDTVAVKVTVYRTSKDSGVVEALRRARENGKDAVAMVELKASFDEQRNIEWARGLEAAGIRVVFSPPKYKVHAKIALVLRREGEELRRYAYIGTGNLNARTAASYIDVGILTAEASLTEEVNGVFNLLTGYSAGEEMDELLVAPFNMRRRFLRLIEREAEHARAGRPALIRGQLNGLADRRLIGALYRASQAGVKIEMMVREICALRPGVPGVSDNIRIVTLVGRFLQHARIFHFHNAGADEYYIGSADWRPRNMVERIEVATPVRDPDHQRRLADILDETLAHPDGWLLRPDGTYLRDGRVIGLVHPPVEVVA